MSDPITSKEQVWLAIGWGEGSAEMRIVHNDREMVQWLWEQCGPDHTGKEESTRNYWYSYLEDADNWMSLDGLPRWSCEIDIGETGHVEFQLLHGLNWPALEPEPALRPDGMPEPSLDVLKRVAARMRVSAPDTAYLVEWAIEQIEEQEASFDLRWNADMRAIKRWQEAHPGNDLTWPDHTDMVVWLLEQFDARAAQPPGADACTICGQPMGDHDVTGIQREPLPRGFTLLCPQRCQCGSQPWEPDTVEIQDSLGALHYLDKPCSRPTKPDARPSVSQADVNAFFDPDGDGDPRDD